MILNVLAAHATGPYQSGTAGYDISYPQCTSATLPTGAFGIVGVTNGRPFSGYSCLGKLYTHAAASGTPSLYLNTGYSGAYRKNITTPCSAGPSQAWEIGCSEADYAANQASGLDAAMWWLDVETGNSWSTSSLSLNQATIQGAVDRLLQLYPNVPVGVYSTRHSWSTITGSAAVYTPTGTSAQWIAGAGGSCASSGGFDSNPIWLSQFANGGFDGDNAC
ncbi:MAG TPA: hypothetical protein VFK22_06640 [Candidatus Dormibacteraeota bacterium]|nr:hypothetical protein [Candidatus Dormibacteraeota bacterium]